VQRVAFPLHNSLRLCQCLSLRANHCFRVPPTPLSDHCHALSSIMTSDICIHSRHAWSLMNEEVLTHKLHKLGLILNRPEPALICRQCKYALQPSGTRISKQLAEKHAISASERKELVRYIDSLHLPNPNSLGGRRNGSEPHQHLLVSRGAACKYWSSAASTSKAPGLCSSTSHASTGHLTTAHNGFGMGLSCRWACRAGHRMATAGTGLSMSGLKNLPVFLTA
jgi:hypothetical protein